MKKLLLVASVLMFGFTSCQKDDVEPSRDDELTYEISYNINPANNLNYGKEPAIDTIAYLGGDGEMKYLTNVTNYTTITVQYPGKQKETYIEVRSRNSMMLSVCTVGRNIKNGNQGNLGCATKRSSPDELPVLLVSRQQIAGL